MAAEVAPIPCEYETREGRGCPNRARIRVTFVQPSARGISGEPVKFYCHACYAHADTAQSTVVQGITIESVEPLA